MIAATLFIVAMPAWVPAGEAGVGNIVWPLVLAPLIWALLFVYTCIEENLFRCAVVTMGTIFVCGVVVGAALAGWL